MAVLGIMNSYLEPADEPSGLTLREQFETLAYGRVPPTAAPTTTAGTDMTSTTERPAIRAAELPPGGSDKAT